MDFRDKRLATEGKNVVKGVGDVLLLVGGDAVEEWERESAAGYGFGEGKAYCGAGMCLPGGLQMDGREVAAGGDALLSESFLDMITIYGLGEANDIDEPADYAVGKIEWGEFEARDGAEELVVVGCGGLAEGQYFVDAGKLNAA